MRHAKWLMVFVCVLIPLLWFTNSGLASPKYKVLVQILGDNKYKDQFLKSVEKELVSLGKVEIVEKGYDYAILLSFKGYTYKDSDKPMGWAIGYVFCVLKINEKCNLKYIDKVYSNVLFADVGELEKSAKEIVNKMDKSFLR